MACPLSGPFAAGEVTFSAVTHGYRTELEGPWCSSVIGRVRGMGRLGAVNGVRELALSVDDPVDGADQGSTSSSILLSRSPCPVSRRTWCSAGTEASADRAQGLCLTARRRTKTAAQE